MVLNNKKGQMIVYRIMFAIVILIAVVLISSPIKEIITNTYNDAALDCTSGTLTYTQVATCAVLDNAIFYFLGSCAAVGIAFLAGKKNITGVISAIFIFILALVLINPVKEWIVYVRDANHLSCASATMTLGNKLACIFFDAWLFWFLATIFAAGLTYLFAKEVLQ